MTDAQEQIYGTTDHRDDQGARERDVDGGGMPQAWDIGCDPAPKFPPSIRRICSPFLSVCGWWSRPAEWSHCVAQAKRAWFV
jgi:hypothetical protein